MRVLSDSLRKEYTVLLTCPFLRRNQVSTLMSREYGSRAWNRTDLLDIIEEQWSVMRKEKPFLFNQSKFRYYSGTLTEEPSPRCILRLGLTDYKSYVGSNLGSKWEVFYKEGVKIGDPSAYFANPFGNQCAVVLNDGHHILLNRSYQVSEGQGQLTCVGGHPEPSEIHIQDYDDAETTSPALVADELFNSMTREIQEETNIPYDLVSAMSMIGVLACNTSHGRQVQLFCCFVNLNREQALAYYRKGPKDQYESLGINFLTLDAILDRMNANPESFVPETRGVYSVLAQNQPLFQSFLQNH